MQTARASKPMAFWLLAGLCGFLALCEAGLLFITFSNSDQSALQAVQQSQRIRILAKDGSVEGAMKEQAPAHAELPLDTEQVDVVPEEIPDTGQMPMDEPATAPTTPATPKTTPEPAPKDDRLAKVMEEFAYEIDDKESTGEMDEPVADDYSALSPSSMVADESVTLDAIPMEPRTAASLAAPYSELLETTATGKIPRKNASTTPFEHYRRPFTKPAKSEPIIALVVTGLGGVKAQTEMALQLPQRVTLAFNPYAQHTPTWLDSARNTGHESWLMLPAQPEDYPASDDGPDALLKDQPADELMTRLHRTMAKAQGYPGLILGAEEGFSDSLGQLKILQQELDKRGLALIAAKAPDNTSARGWMKNEPLAMAGNVVIDEELTEKAILQKLSDLEVTAKANGRAMGVIHSYPLSMKLTAEWISKLQDKGFVLAPASALMQK